MSEQIINGYVVSDHKTHGYYPMANGRSYTYITCPFCKYKVKAYVWSLSGGGKKCPKCKALHTRGRTIIKAELRPDHG